MIRRNAYCAISAMYGVLKRQSTKTYERLL